MFKSIFHIPGLFLLSFLFMVWFATIASSFSEEAEKPELRLDLSENEWPNCVTFLPNGEKLFAGTNAGQIWIWDRKEAAKPKKVRLTTGGLLSGSVMCLAISPDGSRILAGCADRTLRLIDVKTGEIIHVLKKHKNPVFSVSFSPDGKTAFSGSSGGALSTIIHWDLKTGKPIQSYEANDIVDGLAISPDGKRFLTTEFKTIQEWDAKTGERLRVLKGHESRITSVFYSPDGKKVISGGYDSVCLWDAKTGNRLRTIDVNKNYPDHFALSPDGRRLLVELNPKEVVLLDLETSKELKRWKKLAGKACLAFSPDGRFGLIGEAFGPLSLWALPDTKSIKESPTRK